MLSLEFLLTLNSLRIGSAFYERLLKYFGSPEAISSATTSQLLKIPRVSTFARELPQALKEKAGEKELIVAQKYGVKIISFESNEYPERLKSIFDYPLVLYVRGNIRSLSNDLVIAIVGTRQVSVYGQIQAERIGYGLAHYGFCVVSGLARGIDTAAHQGAIKSKSGKTIAVLGNGLKYIYPPENKRLLDKIVEQGAVISELPINTPPLKINFPVRNRIISGLSLGVVVIEAPLRSGALITADFALEQGREVFALPGKVDNPASRGCHYLIKQGAKLVENIDDILDEFNIIITEKASCPLRSAQSLSPDERVLLSILNTSEPLNIDDIIDQTRLPSSLILTTLLTLEMKKLVRQFAGKSYIRV